MWFCDRGRSLGFDFRVDLIRCLVFVSVLAVASFYIRSFLFLSARLSSNLPGGRIPRTRLVALGVLKSKRQKRMSVLASASDTISWEFWRELVLATIGEQFAPNLETEDDINGISLCMR